MKKEGYTINETSCGDLTSWAKQGVLLLNTALTVKKGNANSHKELWREYINKVIEYLASLEQPIVWILWGSNAKQYIDYIDRNKHYIIAGVHPSPLSANRGFFDYNYFGLANEWLMKNNIDSIDWNL